MGALWTAIGLAVFVVIILALLGIAMEPGTSSYEGRSQPLFAPAPLPGISTNVECRYRRDCGGDDHRFDAARLSPLPPLAPHERTRPWPSQSQPAECYPCRPGADSCQHLAGFLSDHPHTVHRALEADTPSQVIPHLAAGRVRSLLRGRLDNQHGEHAGGAVRRLRHADPVPARLLFAHSHGLPDHHGEGRGHAEHRLDDRPAVAARDRSLQRLGSRPCGPARSDGAVPALGASKRRPVAKNKNVIKNVWPEK
jgi:hypothetical protein